MDNTRERVGDTTLTAKYSALTLAHAKVSPHLRLVMHGRRISSEELQRLSDAHSEALKLYQDEVRAYLAAEGLTAGW